MLGDEGIVGKYHAELARDWYDVYLVRRVGCDTDVEIRQGNSTLPMGVLFSTASTSGEAAQSGQKSSAVTFMNPSKAATPRNAGRR